MKANEFVLELGWDAAKRLVENNKHTGRTLSPSELELKRLVESYELVERIIKDHNKTFADGQIGMPELRRMAFGAGWKRFPKGLKQAIADVESCQCVEQ